MARYSFVGFDPAGTLTYTQQGLEVTGALPQPSRDQDPMEYVRRIQAFYSVDDHQTPFVGGLVGSLGYDLVRFFEPTLETGQEEAWPRFVLGAYLDGLVYDHQEGTVEYVSRGEDRSELVQEILQDTVANVSLSIGPVTTPVDDATFEDRVRAAQAAIRQGEAFQIVLSRPFVAEATGPLGPLYDVLREAAAVPYLYHLRFGNDELLGASPEMLVRVRDGVVETFPIAGTRPLTGDAAVDAASAQDLLADVKETAEHAMLVDLARNDLGRVSAPGSVKVAAFQELHKFRTVQHLVSRVTGELDTGRDAFDALGAVFPAGTVSGAPKVRAMEHIDRLETAPRGPYAGAVAYFSFNGDFDSAIAIRSLSSKAGKLTVQAGAGIVHRSNPADEAAETRHKAATMLEALAQFQEVLA